LSGYLTPITFMGESCMCVPVKCT